MLFCWLCHCVRWCVLARVMRLWRVVSASPKLPLRSSHHSCAACITSPIGDITARSASHYLTRGRHYLRLRTLPILKIAVSVTSLILCLISPRELRENSEGTPTQLSMTKKCYLLRLTSKKVDFIPEKVDSFPKSVALYSCLYTLYFTHYTRKITPKSDFSCTSRKKSVTLRPNKHLYQINA